MNADMEKISTFKFYADRVLESQLSFLKQGDYMVGSKLGRLKILNEHLEELKDILQQRMDIMLSDMTPGTAEYKTTKLQLAKYYKQYIIDYLSKTFLVGE
jgi:hypothetical protein